MSRRPGELICPYCRDALGRRSDALRCGSCGTPHHRACWREAGACTIAGCGASRQRSFGAQGPPGRVVLRPAAAAAPSPPPAPAEPEPGRPRPRALSRLEVLLGGLAVLVLCLGLAALVGHRSRALTGTWELVTLGGGMLGAALLVALLSHAEEGPGSRGLLILCVVALLPTIGTFAAFGLGRDLRVALGQHAGPIPVADVPLAIAERGRLETFELRDGHVETSLMSHIVVESRGGRRSTRVERTHYYAAPLVPEGWAPPQPVPAWVVGTGERAEVVAAWCEPRRGGVLCRDEHAARAVAGSARHFKLESRAGAPKLEWVEAPVRGAAIGVVAYGLVVALTPVAFVMLTQPGRRRRSWDVDR